MINLKIQMTQQDFGDKLRREFLKLPGLIGDYIAEKTKDNWLSGVSPDQVPWAPLKESTIQSRKKRNISGIRPLLASMDMFNSMTVVKGLDSCTITIDGPSNYHQKGNPRLPQRQILPDGKLPDDWQRDISALMENRLKVLFGD